MRHAVWYGAAGLMFGTGLSHLILDVGTHWIYGLLVLLSVALFAVLHNARDREMRSVFHQIRKRGPLLLRKGDDGRLYVEPQPKQEEDEDGKRDSVVRRR